MGGIIRPRVHGNYIIAEISTTNYYFNNFLFCDKYLCIEGLHNLISHAFYKIIQTMLFEVFYHHN